MRLRTRWTVAVPLAAGVAALVVAAGVYLRFAGGGRAESVTEPSSLPAIVTVPAPVATALAMLRAGRSELAAHWRYRETVRAGGLTEELAYDPGRPTGGRWRVLQVNGAAPSKGIAKRLTAQADEKAGARGGLIAASSWLSRSIYRLVSTTPKKLVYQLRPRTRAKDASAAARLLRHLSGRLVIGRTDGLPLSLSLENFEVFSPRFGIRVEQFAFQAHFKRLGAAGPVVVTQSSMEARGKILWLKSFEQRTTIALSGFLRVPSKARAPVAQTKSPR